jgi:hypothetical protein
MKVVGEYNNISPELRPKKLEPGEVVHYRLLIGEVNHHPETKKERPIIFPESLTLKTRSRFWDPYKKTDFWKDGDKKGAFVEVVLIDEAKTQLKDAKPKAKKFAVRAQENNGFFAFTGGDVEQEEIYEIIELSNENKSFKYRDTSIQPKFERVDYKAEAKLKLKKQDELTDALIYIKNLSEKDARELAAAMNWNENEEEEILFSSLKQLAIDKPGDLLKLVNNPDLKNKALLKYALTKDIIRYDATQHRIIWGSTQQTIAKLDRVDGQNPLDLFADWIKTSKNGNNILTSIKKQMNQQIKEANDDTESSNETDE